MTNMSSKPKECLTEQGKLAKWYFGKAMPYTCDLSSTKAPKFSDFKDEDWLNFLKIYHESILKRPSREFTLDNIKDYKTMKELVVFLDSTFFQKGRIQAFYLEVLCRLKQ